MNLTSFILFTRWPHRVAILATSFLSAVFGLLAPFFQKEFIDQLAGSHLYVLPLADFHPLMVLFFSFMCFLTSVGLSQYTNYLGMKESLLMQSIISEKIYGHTLVLRNESLGQKTVGEIISIYTVDVPGSTILLEQTLPQGTTTFFPLILAPLFLFTLYQIPLAGSYGILAILILLSAGMAFRQSKFFFNFKILAAERIGLVNEWLQNIRSLRILSWMESFETKIIDVRKIETKNRINMVTNGQLMNAVSSCITYMLTVLAIWYFIRTSPENKISPGQIMALLWTIGIFLNKPFRQMPWFFTFAFDAQTSINRIEKFLNIKNTENLKDKIQTLSLDNMQPQFLKVKNLNLTIGNKQILKDINLTVPEGALVALVGEVGSGKSLLLLSLVGETSATFENYYYGEKDLKYLKNSEYKKIINYIPQEGFIISSNLRDNIYFDYNTGSEHDQELLFHLNKSELNLADEPIVNSLDLEIGERGVNLSGGQKQRVSLARTSFHKKPIVLIDDSLSAVDVETEEKLLKKLIQGEWKTSSRILCTHRLSLLSHVDYIYFLKDGSIFASGNLKQLQKNCPEFNEFTASIQKMQEEPHAATT